ncbi:MAG: hypothetical protein WC750_06350 [Patescibacteria group bacterium]|jgi:hypothetical protein
MRVEGWDPSALSGFKGVAYKDLLTASYVVKDKTVQKLRGQIKHNISRGVYKKGPYAGEPWTARNAGQLLASVRVVQKKEDMGQQEGRKVADFTNIRVYAGNDLAYYADIFEFYTPYMRPAFAESESEIKAICGVV